MITLTKRGRLVTIIVAALVVMIAIFALLIYLRPNLYSLNIMNRTDRDVVVTETRINGKRVGAGDRILKPRILKDGRYTGNLLDFTFKAVGDSVLVLGVKFGLEKETRLSCDLEDPNGAGCLFYANIRNENELACFCDSYADFND